MLRARGLAADFTSRSLRREGQSYDGRLRTRSALVVIGGISFLLWFLLLEIVTYLRV